LAEALTNKIIGGAGFDVLTVEPPKQGNILLDLRLPNFIVTPHVAWASARPSDPRDQLIDNIEAFAAGKPQNVWKPEIGFEWRTMPTDIDIAQQAHMRRIGEVAQEKLGIGDEHLEPFAIIKPRYRWNMSIASRTGRTAS